MWWTKAFVRVAIIFLFKQKTSIYHETQDFNLRALGREFVWIFWSDQEIMEPWISYP